MVEHWFMLEVLAHELMHPHLRADDSPPEWRYEGDLRGGALLYWMFHNYVRWDPRFQAQGLKWDHSIPGPVCEGGLNHWLDLPGLMSINPGSLREVSLFERSFRSLEEGYRWLHRECRRMERQTGRRVLPLGHIRTTPLMPNARRDAYAKKYNELTKVSAPS